MTTGAPDGRADPIDVIFRSLDDSEWGRRNLPRLVSLLTHDRARVCLGAGWAITYVAEEHPDSAGYLVRRLGDRLTDDEASLATEQAFLGVAARYPDVVDEELDEVLTQESRRQFERDVGGSLLRAEYGAGDTRHRDVGRVRMPRGGVEGDEQRVITDDEGDDRWRRRTDDGDGDDGDEPENDTTYGGRPTGRPARELWAESDVLATIRAACAFEDLAVMSERRRGRYADVYRLRADDADEEIPVTLLRFTTPAEAAAAFGEDLEGALERWTVVDDVEGIRTIHDWGHEVGSWALVEYADKSLAERGGFSTDEALWNARHLAASLSHAHENGVVHGGVDPGNVSYHENLLDPEERQIPMLTNVGVLPVVRQYVDPTARLNPRFAAPEYFDRRFGRVDHASDVYGLGALCYLLFTGRPPYRGDYEAVRDAVVSPTTPTPSAIADVPDGVDDIVAKAMAPEKLHRYEGVTHLAADLRAIAERDDVGRIYEPYPRTGEGSGSVDGDGGSAEGDDRMDGGDGGDDGYDGTDEGGEGDGGPDGDEVASSRGAAPGVTTEDGDGAGGEPADVAGAEPADVAGGEPADVADGDVTGSEAAVTIENDGERPGEGEAGPHDDRATGAASTATSDTVGSEREDE